MILKAYPRITLGFKTFGLDKANNKLTFDALFVLIEDFYDEIHIIKDKKYSVRYLDKHNNAIIMPEDLVTKAIEFLKLNFSIDVTDKIVVQKNVPTNLGLASEASCAAAILKHYLDLHKTPVSFYNVATQISSNTPFFMTGFKVARVQRLGDQISGLANLKLPKIKLHLTNIPTNSQQILEYRLAMEDSLPNNYISILIEDLVNNRPFSVANELSTAINHYRTELLMAEAKIKARHNQVVHSGFGGTIVEIIDPFFDQI